ncbi:RNA polymerase sigma-70 factor [uncultured Draconibacterium sp.]|uniref:RNA polymerase sigma-70 factor n=1 Tax=uncultured Draconibacterium sp. TaxID=1573823 RepID=UPI003217B64F
MQVIGGIPENVLIDRIKQGDQTAFELLFKFYYPGLVVFASHFGIDQADSEEIVQDFFVRIWQHRHKINQSDSLKAYFFTSIKNKSLNVLKQKKRNDKLIKKLILVSEESHSYNYDIFIESELQTKIRTSFNLIPPRSKEVFFLSRVTGISNDEIAKRLDISKRTVETHISNALKILKTELKEFLTLLILIDILLK